MKIKAFFKENKIPLLLALGLLLFIAHYQNQPLLKYVFLPQIGTVILLGVVLFFIANRWKTIKEIGLGSKALWIPLAVISGSAVLRLIVQPDMETLAGAFFMASMFGLYIVSRQYGEKALSFFLPITIIGAVSIIVQAIIVQGGENAGLFNNYATAAQFLVFGWLVSPRKYQWWLAAIVITGLFFSGAEEAIFYVAIIGVVILARRDWSRKILLPVGILGVLLITCTATGMTQILYERGINMVEAAHTVIISDGLTPVERDELMNEALHGRWLYGWRIQRSIQPLGYGLELTYHSKMTPHNIILLVTDQLGVVAAAAWIGAMVMGVKNTKWKYGFLALILFGVFQPFVWTLFAPYMWAMAGSASSSKVDTSYIFREVVATT